MRKKKSNKGSKVNNVTVAILATMAFAMFAVDRSAQLLKCTMETSALNNSFAAPNDNTGLAAATDGAGDGAAMQRWREATYNACDAGIAEIKSFGDAGSKERKRQIDAEAIRRLNVPSDEVLETTSYNEARATYKHCKHVFIDLGANIGDTLAEFSEGHFDLCTPLWTKAIAREIDGAEPKLSRMQAATMHDISRIAINMNTLQYSADKRERNDIAALFYDYLDPQAMTPVGMSSSSNKHRNTFREDMCAYALEGNPTFTARLNKLENMLMMMKPRPMEHVHVFTQTVVSMEDGETELFLDIVNPNDNFWGSSLISNHGDAVASAKKNGGKSTATPVKAISPVTLLKNTLMPFKPGATADEKSGGSVVIKMDVEGVEFDLLKLIAESQVLCDYVRMGNQAVMAVEYHLHVFNDKVEKSEMDKRAKVAIAEMQKCGVKFAAWK